ncbi:MAG TPA: hypothetical protein VM070_01210, partial [Candidatus Saccharimonadales bacterium]|nr:hypothetical protein [Candidatus Saccharimonadales bacterium]
TLLALYPERHRELAGVIALHLERAGEDAAAVPHLVAAGDHALERFANREAMAFFGRAVATLDAADPRDDLRLRAALGVAKVAWTYGDPGGSIDSLEKALSLAGEEVDRKLVGAAYFWVAFLRRIRGERPDTSPALKHAAQRSAEIGSALGDPVAQAIPNAFAGVGLMASGELREGTRLLEEALGPIAAHADPQSAAILNGLLTLGYARLGDFTAAERALERAEVLAAGGDPIAALDAQIVRSALLVERGETDAGEALATTCAARSEELGAIACAVPANIIVGTAHLARDDAFGAQAPLERSDELAQVSNMEPFRTLAQGMLGFVRTRLGDVPGGAADWDLALERAHAGRDRYGEAITLWQRARARLGTRPPDLEAARADLDLATQLFEAMGARPSHARSLRDRGNVLRAMGHSDDADRDLEHSQAIAASLGLRDLAPAAGDEERKRP